MEIAPQIVVITSPIRADIGGVETVSGMLKAYAKPIFLLAISHMLGSKGYERHYAVVRPQTTDMYLQGKLINDPATLDDLATVPETASIISYSGKSGQPTLIYAPETDELPEMMTGLYGDDVRADWISKSLFPGLIGKLIAGYGNERQVGKTISRLQRHTTVVQELPAA